MTTDLETQIHAYGTQLIDSQPPITAVDVSDLLAKIRELPPIAPPVRQKARPWVAVGVGLAVLVLFGGLTLLLSRGAADAPPANQPSTVAPSTTPPNTTTPPDENAGAALGTSTYVDLPNESSIGWKWYETGISSPGSIWRLRNGTYVAYDQGFDGTWDQDDGSVLFSIGTSSVRFADPTESFLISADGESWDEVPLDRFDGFVAYAEVEIPAGAPYFYVFVRPIDADPNAAASWSTWATDDGGTWFEVLIDGESGITYFNDYAQIRNTAIAERGGDTGGFLVSSDGGRSFTAVDPSAFLPYSFGDLAMGGMYVYDGTFRLIRWTEGRSDTEPYIWMQNPLLWESTNGKDWTLLGPTVGLEPQPDGRAVLATWGGEFATLANGSLLFSGAGPEATPTSSGDPAAYVLTSSDGGMTWNPVDTFPTSGHRTFGSELIPAASGTTTVDGWVILTFWDTAETLATNGDMWVRIDDPPGADERAFGIRGAIMNGMEWILLPSS